VTRITIGTQKARERKAGPFITQVFHLGGEAGLLLSLGLDEEEPGLRLLPPVELLLQSLRELEQPFPLMPLLPLLLFASASLRLLREGVSSKLREISHEIYF
jgi:hypothetical protein